MKSQTKIAKVAFSVSPMLYERICKAASGESMTVEEWVLGLIHDELDMDKDIQEAMKALDAKEEPADWNIFKKAWLNVSDRDP